MKVQGSETKSWMVLLFQYTSSTFYLMTPQTVSYLMRNKRSLFKHESGSSQTAQSFFCFQNVGIFKDKYIPPFQCATQAKSIFYNFKSGTKLQ